jgi:hypothetical protein
MGKLTRCKLSSMWSLAHALDADVVGVLYGRSARCTLQLSVMEQQGNWS